MNAPFRKALFRQGVIFLLYNLAIFLYVVNNTIVAADIVYVIYIAIAIFTHFFVISLVIRLNKRSSTTFIKWDNNDEKSWLYLFLLLLISAPFLVELLASIKLN